MTGSRPTRVEIDLHALRHNLASIRAACGAERSLLAVVKADAYGHGSTLIAPELQRMGIDWFGVATVDEGIELREAGVSGRILVLGGIYPGEETACFRYGLVPVIFSAEGALRLQAAAEERNTALDYHLKIDTGMGRLGARPEELPALLDLLKRCSWLHMTGFASHYALADEPESPANDRQDAAYAGAKALLAEKGFSPQLRHIGNSAALFTGRGNGSALIRPGIVLYGGFPSDHFSHLDLKPVMHFCTGIAQIKEVPAGYGVSYGHRFVASRPTRLATIPVGYADGYSRGLSGKGEVLIRGRRFPIAGTVCMDWTMIDVTDAPEIAVGDTVTLIGADDAGNCISAEEIGTLLGTIGYEVLCAVGKRVPRVVRRR